jgi:glycosyltransferase involved in cell wall biosynthesis
VARTPSIPLFSHCLEAKWRLLPNLADSFLGRGLRDRFSNWRLARLLNRPEIEVVSNHQVPACRNLARLGVDPAKIVPWDWPRTSKPADHPIKTGVGSAGQISVMYAGAVSESKGVGDLIHAIARLDQSKIQAKATIAGQGEIEHFRDLAARLGVADRIHFTGVISHTQVVALMHEHDVVVVPSRHSYPEGLPMTIFDALASRSPLVVSDHPMFVGPLEEGHSALVFPGEDSKALANCLDRLLNDRDLYSRLSENSEAVWLRLRIPVLWGDLVKRWLAGGREDIEWLRSYSLAQYAYK